MELLSFVNKLSVRYTEYIMICARVDQLAEMEYYPLLLVSDTSNIKRAIRNLFMQGHYVDESRIRIAIDTYINIRKDIKDN